MTRGQSCANLGAGEVFQGEEAAGTHRNRNTLGLGQLGRTPGTAGRDGPRGRAFKHEVRLLSKVTLRDLRLDHQRGYNFRLVLSLLETGHHAVRKSQRAAHGKICRERAEASAHGCVSSQAKPASKWPGAGSFGLRASTPADPTWSKT